MVVVSNTFVTWNSEHRACRTCPAGITIGPSHTYPGRLGVWAERGFEKDSIFGPFEGDLVDRKNLRKLKLAFQGGYAWQIYTDGELSYCIDGSDEKKSNWLRYVKCARNKEESNVVAFEQFGKVYHGTTKHIVSGTEILVSEEAQFCTTPPGKWKERKEAEHLTIL
ncbi:histone-lysine N-methyltransferase PRDM7-like [Clavelina lepadiformis]|uniref:histone-lysine N-methyltransferase PRDM7-like n=1 Tax=Clavelina lepadiformis TaxID=159417 RepID=UPI0040432553